MLPILFDANESEIRAGFFAANGLLLTGGNATLFGSPYAAAVDMLMAMAVNSSRMGNPFPVWGTCLGFEALVVYAAGGDALDRVDAEALFLPLEFDAHAEQSSMLAGVSPQVLHRVATDNVTINLHNQGVLLDHFLGSAKLQSAFQVLATNTDRAGKRFVSLIAGRDLPFFGAQFHPEKNAFEWDQSWDSQSLQIHSTDAVVFSQQLAAFFVNTTRANRSPTDKPNPAWLASKLIYNFAPTYTSSVFPDKDLWEQAYFMSPPAPPPFYRPCTCDADCGLVWATGCEGGMICTNPARCSCLKCPCSCG